MLKAQTTEWREIINDARRELSALGIACRQAEEGPEPTVAEEEGALEFELAQTDLARLEEAARLLQGIAAQLDDTGRATLALAANVLYEVDPCRPDSLASETTRLREIRLRMPSQ